MKKCYECSRETKCPSNTCLDGGTATFLMNDINEDGGTPGFDEAACFTLTLSEPSDLLALCSASNNSFEDDEFCTCREKK